MPFMMCPLPWVCFSFDGMGILTWHTDYEMIARCRNLNHAGAACRGIAASMRSETLAVMNAVHV